jgi:hypothetical protein
VIILLAGGDENTQSRDIKAALHLAQNLQDLNMAKNVTTNSKVSEHLRTSLEIAAYLEMRIEKVSGDRAFIAK